MFRRLYYRNAHARDLLDTFLISAICSLLLVRFYLEVTGYPQLATGGLHIAHMLYGGMAMMIAIVLSLAFLGSRVKQLTAVIGGIGFGIFIDELGKFITKDNNYFFEPTIGIIYATFVILYLSFNFLTKYEKLSSQENQLNALAEMEEAVAHDMDKAERARINAFLAAANQRSIITQQLIVLMNSIDVSAAVRPSRLHSFFRQIDRLYARFWQNRKSHRLVSLLFVTEAVILISGVIFTIYSNTDDITALLSGPATYGEELLIGQIIASVVAVYYVIYGLTLLAHSRLEAFEQFRRAALVNLYLTQFFVFVRVEFDAMPGFVINLVVLILISFVIRQERRLGNEAAVL
jgi:hypothetical protein